MINWMTEGLFLKLKVPYEYGDQSFDWIEMQL